MIEITPSVRRVLVVDDDPDINRLMRTRLKSRGYEVDSASNGEEALIRLEEFRPDLALLDVSMPGIGGLEVLERIRSQGLDMSVIMMTAFGSEGVAIEALRHGADDYLRKPFEPNEFQAILERTVSRLELSRQNTALRRQLEAELMRATQVQAALLPQTSPALPGFQLAARCWPAREVGGDFYDWLEPDNGILKISIGDVMGKGMPAALLMATVRAALRAVASQNSPAAALNLTAQALERDLDHSDSFITLFHLQLDIAARRGTYVDAGHGHAFIRRAGGAAEALAPRGLPLGMPFGQEYQEGTTTFEAGDCLVLYSDGLIDARPDLELTASKLAELLQGASSAGEMVDRIADLTAVSGPPPDDLTVVVLYCSRG